MKTPRPSRLLASCLLQLILAAAAATGITPANAAEYRTENFIVHAPSEEIARKLGQAAEVYREELAIEWLGEPMPKWSQPCPIKVKVGKLGAGGATTFSFDRGEVFGWRMTVQGTYERILDSVLPHEISHTIFACHFRRPLPRWADEGAATLVEHESERRRQTKLLGEVMDSGEKIPLRRLFSMTEYPEDMRKVLTLYAQGYSLADFFVQLGGKTTYLQFLQDAHTGGWDAALKKHYDLQSVEKLEQKWDNWVIAGSPAFSDDSIQLAANTQARGQSPEQRPSRENETVEPSTAREVVALAPLPPPSRTRRSPESQPGLNAPEPTALSLPNGRQRRGTNDPADPRTGDTSQQNADIGNSLATADSNNTGFGHDVPSSFPLRRDPETRPANPIGF